MALKKVIGAKAVTSKIIVELIPAKELLNTKLIIEGEIENSGPPQAYITDIGPSLTGETGFKVGDRVILSGTYCPIFFHDIKNARPKGVIEVHDIKAVLIEEE